MVPGTVSTKRRVNDVDARVPLRRLEWYQVVPSGTEDGGGDPTSHITWHLANEGHIGIPVERQAVHLLCGLPILERYTI